MSVEWIKYPVVRASGRTIILRSPGAAGTRNAWINLPASQILVFQCHGAMGVGLAWPVPVAQRGCVQGGVVKDLQSGDVDATGFS